MVKLTDEDFELMNPGEEFAFGKTKVFVKPLPIFSDTFKQLYCKLKNLESKFNQAGITLENFPYKLPHIAKIIIEESQDIVELLIPLEPGDIKKLPTSVLIKYFEFFTELNKKSLVGMEKNSNTWAETLKKGLHGVTLIFAMFSSVQDTENPKSEHGQPVKSGLNSEPSATAKPTDIKNIIKE